MDIDERQRQDAFLSIQAQDFIEESVTVGTTVMSSPFLSIQAQDFIEEDGGENR